jgi:hypothetical protein
MDTSRGSRHISEESVVCAFETGATQHGLKPRFVSSSKAEFEHAASDEVPHGFFRNPILSCLQGLRGQPHLDASVRYAEKKLELMYGVTLSPFRRLPHHKHLVLYRLDGASELLGDCLDGHPSCKLSHYQQLALGPPFPGLEAAETECACAIC